MKTQRLIFFEKIVSCHSTLSITKEIFKHTKFKGYYAEKVMSNIKELLEVFKKSRTPYKISDMEKFLNNQIKTIEINNGYCKWEVSI